WSLPPAAMSCGRSPARSATVRAVSSVPLPPFRSLRDRATPSPSYPGRCARSEPPSAPASGSTWPSSGAPHAALREVPVRPCKSSDTAMTPVADRHGPASDLQAPDGARGGTAVPARRCSSLPVLYSECYPHERIIILWLPIGCTYSPECSPPARMPADVGVGVLGQTARV